MNQDLKNKIESIISNQKLDEGEILSQLKQLMYKNELQTSSTKNSKSIADLVSANLKQLQGDTHPESTIKTGFTDFDRRFGGFGLGEFWRGAIPAAAAKMDAACICNRNSKMKTERWL